MLRNHNDGVFHAISTPLLLLRLREQIDGEELLDLEAAARRQQSRPLRRYRLVGAWGCTGKHHIEMRMITSVVVVYVLYCSSQIGVC